MLLWYTHLFRAWSGQAGPTCGFVVQMALDSLEVCAPLLVVWVLLLAEPTGSWWWLVGRPLLLYGRTGVSLVVTARSSSSFADAFARSSLELTHLPVVPASLRLPTVLPVR